MDSKDPDALAQRIDKLERQVATMRKTRYGRISVRRRSEAMLFGMPLYDIARGPDPEAGELIGHARGFIAIGDDALGVIAIGGFARGLFALGGLAFGGFTLGGCSFGILVALGGLAIGGVAAGGAAIGAIALGGAAVGYIAIGGAAFGRYVISGAERSPEILQMLDRIRDAF